MPRREYYDRDAPRPDEKLVPASRHKQDAYRYLRSQRSQAVARKWSEICEAFPEVRAAHDNLQAFLQANPHTPFGIFGPEEIRFTDQAGSPVFLR